MHYKKSKNKSHLNYCKIHIIRKISIRKYRGYRKFRRAQRQPLTRKDTLLDERKQNERDEERKRKKSKRDAACARGRATDVR